MGHKIAAGFICIICLVSFDAYAQYFTEGYLPQIANGRFSGGSFRTTFILFNNTDDNEYVSLRLTGDDGKPLAVTIAGLGTGSDFSINLAPGASRMLQTDGSGSLVAGAATVTSLYQIGLSAIFSIYDPAGNFVTEAGVGDSTPLSEFVIPVDITGSFNTGLALFNPAPDETSIEMTLTDSAGKETARNTLTLGPGAHLARFVGGPGQLFPAIGDFRGTLAVTSSSSQISALTLRQNGAPLSYTSLPVLYWGTISPYPFLPHVANGSFGGGSFRTSFLLMNPGDMPASVTMSLTKSDGSPLELTLPGKGTGSSFDFSLDPRASIFLQTDGSGPLAVGAAMINSDVPVGASGIFSVFDTEGRFQTEAGVAAADTSWAFTIPVDITGKFDTGVALFNPFPMTELTLRLLNEDGEPMAASRKLLLDAGKHTAQFVSQLFPGISNFRGSLAISGGNVAALTLRQNSSPLSYTTLPVKQGTSKGKVPALVPQTITGVAATGNVRVDATLASGFKLTGSIQGADYPGLVFAQSGTGEMIEGRIGRSASGPGYILVLPAGSYTLKVCYEQEGYANITFTDPNPVRVSADATRDIILPIYNLTDISGTVAGLSSLPPIRFKSIVFNSPDNTFWTQLFIEDDGRYSGRIAPGSYRANLYLPRVQLPDGRQQHLTVFNFGSLNVGSSPVVANFTLPPLASLSGRLTSAESGWANIIATDKSAPAFAYDSCGYFPAYSYIGSDASGQYQLTLVKDRAYDIQVEQSVSRFGGVYYGTVRYPVPASVVSLSSDSRLDISAPTLPDGVSISGNVTDSAGRGIGDVEIEFASDSLTGAPGVKFSRWQITDSNGYYSFLVLSGTNYRLTFYPPVPAP